MKSQFLFVVLAAAALSSCSTAYKSGQTPDDVYFSPTREVAEYAEIRQSNNGRYSGYQYDDADDRWLRMRVRNPYRWNAFDNYDWNMYSSWSNNYYSPYSYNWNSYWNGYWTWNSWYNPYCRNVIVVNPKTNPAAYNKVRNFSLASYSNTNYNNANTVVRNKGLMLRPTSGGGYNNSNMTNSTNSTGLGNSLRKIFSSGNSNSAYNNPGNSASSNNRPTREYNPSNSNSSSRSGSSSSSSGSSSGGSVSRPGRGN